VKFNKISGLQWGQGLPILLFVGNAVAGYRQRMNKAGKTKSRDDWSSKLYGRFAV
jgi:hypothetical protein